MERSEPSVVIVGGGLAGLRCARELAQKKVRVTLLEVSDRLGGRIKTDVVDGYLLDHGFQVLLTAYPEVSETWDVDALDLQAFQSGAKIWNGQKILDFPDPWKHPCKLWSAFRSPVMPLADKIKLAKLRCDLIRKDTFAHLQKASLTTYQFLKDERGFSAKAIENFFRPFFSGIFLEKELGTDAQMFAYLFPLFAEGGTSLPAKGMQTLATQLADQLHGVTIRTSTPVSALTDTTVTLADGETLHADYIVVATDQSQAQKWFPHLPSRKWGGTSCFYFSCPAETLSFDKTILLNADPTCPLINNIAPLSEVAPSYAPKEKKLLAVSCVTSDQSPSRDAVEKELQRMFGKQTETWQFLQSYFIPRSLPEQSHLDWNALSYEKISAQIYLCGDYQRHSSIQGALESGKSVAQEILSELPHTN